MTILPKIDRTEVDEAVASIAARREKVDNPHFELLTDAPGQVLCYPRKYSTSTLDFTLPDWVRAADVHDGLEAAGVIHSGFRRGFIKDEVVAFDDLVAANRCPPRRPPARCASKARNASWRTATWSSSA